MKIENKKQPRPTGRVYLLKTLNRAMLCALATLGTAQAAPYVEGGRAGEPDSWRSSEFDAEWGLGAINAQQAYAAGYTGKGVKLGIFDQPVYAAHPEFSGTDKVVTLVTSGIREYTDPYIPVKAGDSFRYDGSPTVGSDGKLGSHGTHVGGIAAGSRDGGPMHGVAFDAQIISADNGDPGPEDGIIRGNDGAVYKAGWDALIASGARIINNSWALVSPIASTRAVAIRRSALHRAGCATAIRSDPAVVGHQARRCLRRGHRRGSQRDRDDFRRRQRLQPQ